MHKLFTVTVMLVLLAPAIGCESCLTRGERVPPVATCAPPCEPVCPSGCAPGCGTPGGCSNCGPVGGAPALMPGPG